MPPQTNGLGKREGVARSGLFVRWGHDPDVVAQRAGNRLEQFQSSGVHAVVVGEENAHAERYAVRPVMGQSWRKAPFEMRHISNRAAISSPRARNSLFSRERIIIGASGDKRLSHKLRERQCYLPPAAPL